MERKRPIEQIAQSYVQFVEMSSDVAYALVLLKSADDLLRKAEESGQIPIKEFGFTDAETRRRVASMGGKARAKKLPPERLAEIARMGGSAPKNKRASSPRI